MNHITQRNALEMQLKSYKDFVPMCPNDSLPKLLGEISKIHSRIEKIKELDFDKLIIHVPWYYETKQSKLNFKTLAV
jgi:hypothetical protein